ncbi:MAG: hypothetical protein ABI333_26015 [bacterium]
MRRSLIALTLVLFACGGDPTGDDVDAGGAQDAQSPRDGQLASDAHAADAGAADGSTGNDAGAGAVTSTLTAAGCQAEFSSSRVLVHYNTSLGIVFTDPDVPYAVRGTISFDFPSTFTGVVPNPYSWVDSGIHKEVAVTDTAYTTWGNHCWAVGDVPTGGSATIDVINGPAGIVRATFQGFQLRHCINQAATCTLTGTIETHGTGVFE